MNRAPAFEPTPFSYAPHLSLYPIMSLWLKAVLVFVSGGIGAVCRLLIDVWLKHNDIWSAFPTWLINTVACLLIGIFAGFLTHCSWSDEAKTAFTMIAMTGFCGGFSTFSTFTLDCVRYFESGHLGIWIVFGTATVMFGLFACALGYWIGQQI